MLTKWLLITWNTQPLHIPHSRVGQNTHGWMGNQPAKKNWLDERGLQGSSYRVVPGGWQRVRYSRGLPWDVPCLTCSLVAWTKWRRAIGRFANDAKLRDQLTRARAGLPSMGTRRVGRNELKRIGSDSARIKAQSKSRDYALFLALVRPQLGPVPSLEPHKSGQTPAKQGKLRGGHWESRAGALTLQRWDCGARVGSAWSRDSSRAPESTLVATGRGWRVWAQALHRGAW